MTVNTGGAKVEDRAKRQISLGESALSLLKNPPQVAPLATIGKDAELWIAVVGSLAALAVAFAHLSAWNTASFVAAKYNAPWLQIVAPVSPNTSDWILSVLGVGLVCLLGMVATRGPRAGLAIGLSSVAGGLLLSFSVAFNIQNLFWSVAVGAAGGLARGLLWTNYVALRQMVSKVKDAVTKEYSDSRIEIAETAVDIFAGTHTRSHLFRDAALIASIIFGCMMLIGWSARFNIGKAPIVVEGHPEINTVLRADSNGLIGLDVANRCIWVSTPARLEGPLH